MALKISVVTVVYNAINTIQNCLDSIITQNHHDIEIIVIDGGSNDGTCVLLEAYRDLLTVFISQPDDGIYDAMNKGIAHAKGDIVGFLNADDIYADNNVLSFVSDTFIKYGIDSVYGDITYESANFSGKVIRFWRAGYFDCNKFKTGWMPPHPSFFVRRSIYKKFGTFDKTFDISADYECMSRFLFVERISSYYIPRKLVKMTVGGVSNRSIYNILKKSREDYRVIKKHKIGGFLTLFLKNFRKIPQFFN